jgi:hypothetical protein
MRVQIAQLYISIARVRRIKMQFGDRRIPEYIWVCNPHPLYDARVAYP